MKKLVLKDIYNDLGGLKMPLWKEIIDDVPPHSILSLVENDADIEFAGYQVLTPGTEVSNKLCLYLVCRKMSKAFRAKGMSVIYFSDSPENTWFDDALNCVIINKQWQEYVLTKINFRFGVAVHMFDLMSQVQKAIKNDAGLQTICEAVSSSLEVPVFLVDSSLKILASANRSDYLSTYYDNIVEQRMPSHMDVMDNLCQNSILEKILDAKTLMRIEPDELVGCIRYLLPLVIGHIVAGYLIVFDEKDPKKQRLTEEHFKHLKVISFQLSGYLRYDSFFVLNRGDYISQIIKSTLENEIQNVRHLKKLLLNQHYILHNNLYLLAIRQMGVYAEEKWQNIIASKYRDIFDNSIYMHSGSIVIYLMSRSDTSIVTEEELKDWERYAKRDNICIAITGPFSELSYIDEHKRELFVSLEVCHNNNTGKVVWFQKKKREIIIHSLKKEGLFHSMMHNPILELVEYDNEHGKYLLETLKTYLYRGKRINEICEKLNVHRNTLYKRLEKIKEIIQDDLTDEEVIWQIILTLHMLEFEK